MKILLLGKEGQVGSALECTLDQVGNLLAWDQESADLEQPVDLRAKIRAKAPDVIVNAAGYTAVDRAESEPDKAYRINAEAVEALASYASETGTVLIHYSTDYVFDGTKQAPYTETDRPNPLSVYGQSKFAGEEAIRRSGCRHFLLRTSWVFATEGNNFPRTILKLATERDRLTIVDDQVGAPTSARLMANVTLQILERIKDGRERLDGVTGTYHVCAQGETSWYDYARYIMDQARALGFETRVTPEGITPVATAEYRQAARRPPNSRLNTDKLASWLGIRMPPWETEVARVVREIVLERRTA